MSENIFPVISSPTVVPSAPLYEPNYSSNQYESNYPNNIPSVPIYRPNTQSPYTFIPESAGSSSVKITINQQNVPNHLTNITINNAPINNPSSMIKLNTDGTFISINCPTRRF